MKYIKKQIKRKGDNMGGNGKMMIVVGIGIVILLALIFIPGLIKTPSSESSKSPTVAIENKSLDKNYTGTDYEEIYLAGGCFWGVEEYMERINGVIDAVSGYANGNTENPSYEDVVYKSTGHAETVHVKYDPKVTDLETILLYYFKVIDPTSVNKQGNDRGSQYRTGIYYTDENQLSTIKQIIENEQKNYQKPIAVQVEPLDNFYVAEDYHQDYLKKNPNGYCHIDLGLANEPLLPERNLSSRSDIVDENLYTKPSDEEIKKNLTKEQYNITQNADTEMAFTNKYDKHFEKGIYVDIVTGEPLFSSQDKYDAGCGWPSFSKAIDNNVIKVEDDNSLGMKREEIKSRVGDSHLGHIFNDGPKEDGGLRFCVNGGSLRFVAFDDMEKEGYLYLKEIFN